MKALFLLLGAAAGTTLLLGSKRRRDAARRSDPAESPSVAERMSGRNDDARLFAHNAPTSTPGTDAGSGRIDPGLPDFARGG